MSVISYRPLGYLRSCFRENFGVPRQAGLIEEARSNIRLENWCQPQSAFEGLESFSHVWVLFSFHNLGEYKYSPKVRPPRLNGQKIGVLATRSPHRPNPLGMSIARLERIEGETLWLRGLDLVDGTPILDIKPYIAEYDSLVGSRSGWIATAPNRFIEVDISPEFEVHLNQVHQSSELKEWGIAPDEFKQLVKKVIQLDPRPSSARLTSDSRSEGATKADPECQRFGCNLHGLDVQFEYTDPNRAVVTGIKGLPI